MRVARDYWVAGGVEREDWVARRVFGDSCEVVEVWVGGELSG